MQVESKYAHSSSMGNLFPFFFMFSDTSFQWRIFSLWIFLMLWVTLLHWLLFLQSSLQLLPEMLQTASSNPLTKEALFMIAYPPCFNSSNCGHYFERDTTRQTWILELVTQPRITRLQECQTLLDTLRQSV